MVIELIRTKKDNITGYQITGGGFVPVEYLESVTRGILKLGHQIIFK